MKRRVVVTGLGAVSPLGNDAETLWANIKNGKSGIKRIESEAFRDIQMQIAGFIDDFQGEDYMEAKEVDKSN